MIIKIGTRGSALALAQTNQVVQALKVHHPSYDFQIVPVVTSGDRKQGGNHNTTDFGDKKDWVFELEKALLAGEFDFAIHSSKDVPGNIEKKTTLIPVLSREIPNDIFIGKKDSNTGKRLSFSQIPTHGVVGTASLRRGAALRKLRNDIQVVPHRGNMQTRIKKLDESEVLSGIVLATAGIQRLNINIEYHLFSIKEMVPSMNQGILCAQYREGDEKIKALLNEIYTPELGAIFCAERVCAHTLGGDCNSAIGIHAYITDSTLLLHGEVYDRKRVGSLYTFLSGDVAQAITIGKRVADKLLEMGARKLL